MRITVTIDDALYEEALKMLEPGMDEADLFQQVLRTFVRVQAAKRLAALGGRATDMPDSQEIAYRWPSPTDWLSTKGSTMRNAWQHAY